MAPAQRKAASPSASASASRKTAKKAKRAKVSQTKTARKQGAQKKAARKTTTVAAGPTTAKPISKPPKLDMNSDVMEFIAAIDAYRQEYHRPFPGWSEILFVLKGLGYRKADD